jgi:integrase
VRTARCSRPRRARYRHDYYGSFILAKAVARAGLPTGTTSHDLRHHYVSVLLAAGESVIAVAERLGHENAALVLKTYGDLMPDSEDRTRRAVDTAWEPPAGAVEDASIGPATLRTVP